MSAKAAAAYHGRDIVDRLRSTAPYTEDGPTMRDAADEIERLRLAIELAGTNAIHRAAREAKTRGDIGKPGCVEVWDWLEYWAGREYK